MKTKICVIPIPALKDNYIWLLTDKDKRYGVLVDPGDAEPPLAMIKQLQFQLIAILITHHHWDHSQGVPEILATYPVPVYGSSTESIVGVTHPIGEKTTIKLAELNLQFEVLSIPGHTKGHVAYYGGGMLFCGDTLFASGCGRLFEGTAEQMLASLSRLAALPDETEVYCGHEYTLNNLRFAKTIEPENKDILKHYEQTEQLRNQNLPTLPSQIGIEKRTNPFLRCHIPAVIAAAEEHAGRTLSNPVEVFRELRSWKDNF